MVNFKWGKFCVQVRRFISEFAIVLLGICSIAYPFEFNAAALADLGIENVDLSAFSGSNDRFSGEYIVAVEINNNSIFNNQTIHLYVKNDDSHVCFTSELLNKLPLKKEIVDEVEKAVIHETDVGQCFGLESMDPDIIVQFNSEEQLLSLQLPQLFLENIDSSWIPPSKRESGVSGVFVDYSLLTGQLWNKNRENSNYIRSDGIIGANIGSVRIRGNYQYDSKASGSISNRKFEWTERYAFMDIGNINSKLYVGELFSRTKVFDSVRFKGISLYSDENMMPAYLQGYAPQVTGMANTSALVTIKQYGSIIRSVQVPAGPFAISDLPSYLSGTVDVEVEENNGITYSYQMDIAQVPFLARKGTFRYSANLGKLSPLNIRTVKTNVVSADGTYGLTNNISIYGGAIFTTNNEYRALNVGLGLNLNSFGAFSFDVTQSYNKLDSGASRGNSYRFNYAKRFGQNLSLNLVGYRFSSRDFRTLNNYIDMHSQDKIVPRLEKNRVTLSVSQHLKPLDLSLTASVTKGAYWNERSSSYYNFSVSKFITKGPLKSASVSFSYGRNTHNDGSKENQYMVFVTIPLQEDYRESIQYSGIYQDRNRMMDQQVTYNNKAFGGDVSVGVRASHSRDFSGGVDYSLTALYDKRLSFGRAQLSADYTEDSQQIRGSLDGSITVTRYGIATHEKVYNDRARLIVGVGAPDVIVGNPHNKSNLFGIAGISNVPEYYRNTYMVDNDNLPDNVEIQSGVVDVALTDGAIAYRSLGAVTGEKALVTIVLPDGTNPPFGAIVYRENGGVDTEVAMVAENGLTYLTGLNVGSVFSVKWNRVMSCQLKIHSLKPQNFENLTCNMD